MGNRSKQRWKRKSSGHRVERRVATWNPFRTPGIAPEDQSAFSPGGQFDARQDALTGVQRLVAARAWLRWSLLAVVLVFVVLAILK